MGKYVARDGDDLRRVEDAERRAISAAPGSGRAMWRGGDASSRIAGDGPCIGLGDLIAGPGVIEEIEKMCVRVVDDEVEAEGLEKGLLGLEDDGLAVFEFLMGDGWACAS